MPNFSKWQEWAIPVAILAGLFVILTPLPTQVIDLMLAANMIAAIMILSAALLVRSSAELSVFPAILLVSTLSRLVLNISTTRLILSNATSAEDLAAGGIIQRFGEFVIGNEIFVGVVIFAIIFIIQFVVVTKGSSRISEVAARFALDGMPGKQMAIDADLKAKLITPEQAREQRLEIQSHADFLGAMDGAGRFVRGDAIAGAIITCVNIIGGLAIGLFNGMAFSQAVDVYTRLTIGDGLVSQIPAFLIAISAGILMARGSRQGSVSNELVDQVTSDPRVMYFAGFGAAAFILAGMPPVPLLLISAGCFALGFARSHSARKQSEAEKEPPAPAANPAVRREEVLEDLLKVDPMEIRLGYRAVQIASRASGGTLFDDVNKIRKSLLAEYGFILPKVRICDDTSLKETQFQILISGNPVCEGRVQLGRLMAVDQGKARSALANPEVETRLGTTCYWIDPEQEVQALQARYRVLTSADYVAEVLRKVAIQHASELFTRDSASRLIDELKKQVPVVVNELIPRKLSLSQVQKVLKNLLDERISIRQLALILEALGDYSPHTNQVDELTELVREKLSRGICSQFAINNQLDCIRFDDSVEKKLIEQFEFEQSDLKLVDANRDLKFGFSEDEFKGFAEQIGGMTRPGHDAVLIVNRQIRSWMQKRFAMIRCHLNVMAEHEINHEFEINELGEVVSHPNIRMAA